MRTSEHQEKLIMIFGGVLFSPLGDEKAWDRHLPALVGLGRALDKSLASPGRCSMPATSSTS